MAEESSSKPANNPIEPAVAGELRQLVQRAQTGDATALPHIREILDEHREIWEFMGDLSAVVERAWLAVLGADNPLAVESMKRTIAEMKRDLAGEHPSRMEQMLVDQIVATWLEMKTVESAAANPGKCSLEVSSFRLKRLESAQRRHTQALNSLATMRSLIPVAAPPSPLKLFNPERKHKQA